MNFDRNAVRSLRAGLGKEDNEFVAVNSPDNIGRPDIIFDGLNDGSYLLDLLTSTDKSSVKALLFSTPVKKSVLANACSFSSDLFKANCIVTTYVATRKTPNCIDVFQ